MIIRSTRSGFILALLCGVLALPVTAQEASSEPAAEVEQDDAAIAGTETRDPWQGFNRRVQGLNDRADRFLLKPLAIGYTKIIPKPLRRGITNALRNLEAPLVVANQLLQGKPKLAFADTGRFIVNSTVGLAGFLDPATKIGLERHQEDFGQTFARWGIPSGPYVVLPFLGASTVRDGFGSLTDFALTPATYVDDDEIRFGVGGLTIIDLRAGLLDAETLISGDRYLFLRDAYIQQREFLINDGEIEDDPFLDDFDDEDF